MDLKKMQNISEKYISKFTKSATKLIMDEVTGTDEIKGKVIRWTARDMAIGAMIKRKEHILTGVSIGVVGTTLTFVVGNRIKNKLEEDDIKMKDIFKRLFKDSSVEETKIDEETIDEVIDSLSDKTNELRDNVDIIDEVNEILKGSSDLEEKKTAMDKLNTKLK